MASSGSRTYSSYDETHQSKILWQVKNFLKYNTANDYASQDTVMVENTNMQRIQMRDIHA
jgi:hypothetical protein